MIERRKIKLYESINGRQVVVGTATYQVFHIDRVPSTKMPFIVRDLADVIQTLKANPNTTIDNYIRCSTIYNIDTFRIYKKYRHNGFGSRQIKAMCYTFTDSGGIVCIKSAPLIADYPKEPDSTTRIAELIKQGFFLEINGFRDINSLCGFENGVAYLYINNAAKPILKHIITDEIRE